MSDKSLEDFFAKKDKSKKSKSKSKFAKSTTEEYAKRLTEADLKKERKEKEKEKPPPPKEIGLDDKSRIKDIIGDEDDWRENEEEKEKDYSGLKIQLQISSNPDQDVEEEEEEEYDENGEPIRGKGAVPSGPWNKLDAEAEKEPESAPAPPPPKPVKPAEPAAPAAKVAGKYIPPSLRGMAGGKSSSTLPARLAGRSKTAPQISSEQEFPSLGASADIAKYADKNVDKHFEKVTRGGPSMPNPGSQGPQLDLENRFAALEQN